MDHPLASAARVVLTPGGRPLRCVVLPGGVVGARVRAEDARRLEASPRVVARPGDRRGRVDAGAPSYDARVEVLRSGGRHAEVLGRLRRRYGVLAAGRWLPRRDPVVVLVTPTGTRPVG